MTKAAIHALQTIATLTRQAAHENMVLAGSILLAAVSVTVNQRTISSADRFSRFLREGAHMLTNTLNSSKVIGLLDRLFAEADATEAALEAVVQSDASALITSKTGYRQFYGLLKDMPLPVSRETGYLLYMLARSSRAQSILEFGTSFGVSTIYLAAALRDNGAGRIITTEFEPSKAARAREHLNEAGLIDLVEIREETPWKR